MYTDYLHLHDFTLSHEAGWTCPNAVLDSVVLQNAYRRLPEPDMLDIDAYLDAIERYAIDAEEYVND